MDRLQFNPKRTRWQAILLILFFCVQGFAQDTLLNGQWHFIQSKTLLSPEEISAQTTWQTVNAPSLLPTNPVNGLYGTYRTTFDIPKTTENLAHTQSLYLTGIRHNDRTYLNGQLIGQTGKFADNWRLVLDNPNNLPRLYDLPNGLLKLSSNELIIQVQLGFGESFGAMLPGGVGISGDIQLLENKTASSKYHQILTNTQVFDSIIILLGIIDLAIILLLFKSTFHKFPEFIWLLLGSTLLFSGSLLLDIGYLQGTTNDATKLILILSILFTPLVNAIFFNTQQQLASPSLIWLTTSVVVICSFLLLMPFISDKVKAFTWIAWTIVTGILFLFALICAALNVKQKRTGGVTMLLGLCIYIISIRTQWLPFDGLHNRNLVIGSLVFRYALIWAYFLKIKAISQNYRNLSSQMLSTLEEHKKSTARDIHDELGQHLSSATLQLQLNEETGKSQHQTLLKSELKNAISSMRRIIDGLHPAILDKHSLSEAIRIESERLKRLHHISITSNIQELTLPSSMNAHIYRLIQELLSNAIRHGQAQHASVTIYQKKQSIVINVEDNGLGKDKALRTSNSGGFGHISLKERVQLLGGNIRYHSPNKRSGTKVLVTLPFSC